MMSQTSRIARVLNVKSSLVLHVYTCTVVIITVWLSAYTSEQYMCVYVHVHVHVYICEQYNYVISVYVHVHVYTCTSEQYVCI